MRRVLFGGLIACGFLMFAGSRCSAGTTLIWGSGSSQGGQHSMTDVPGEQLQLVVGPFALVDLTFSWGQRPGAPGTFTRVAFGDVFLLSQQYTSRPATLSSATPGFLAEAKASSIVTDATGSYWVFDSSVALLQNTLYYFYSDSAPSGTLFYTMNDYTSSASNPNEARFFATSTTGSFQPTSATSNNYFELTGDPTVAPEPSTLAGAATGLLMVVGYAWRKRRRPKVAAV